MEKKDEKVTLKRRFTNLGWTRIVTIIAIVLMILIFIDVGISKHNGTFVPGYDLNETTKYKVPEQQEMHMKINVPQVNFEILEEKLIAHLEKENAGPLTKDLLLLFLKTYEINDARMRALVNSGDELTAIAKTGTKMLIEDQKNGIKQEDKILDFVETLEEKITEGKDTVNETSNETDIQGEIVSAEVSDEVEDSE